MLYANTFQIFLKMKIVIYQWAQPIISIVMASIFNKLVFMEILKICASKDNVNRVESNPQDGRKYLQIIYPT